MKEPCTIAIGNGPYPSEDELLSVKFVANNFITFLPLHGQRNDRTLSLRDLADALAAAGLAWSATIALEVLDAAQIKGCESLTLQHRQLTQDQEIALGFHLKGNRV